MKLLLRLIRYIFPFKKYILLIFISHIFYSLFSLVSLSMVVPFLSVLFEKVTYVATKPSFALTTQTVTDYFNYYMSHIIISHGKIQALIAVALSMIVLSFLSNFFRYLGLYFMAPIRVGFVKSLREDIYHKFIILPLSFYAKEKKGDLMNRVGSDVQEVEWSIVSMLFLLFRDPLLVILFLISLFLISPQLTLIALLVLPFAGYLIALVGKKIKKKSIKAQEILGKLSSVFEETISGLRIIKAYNAIEHVSKNFKERNHYFYKLYKKIYIRTELAGPIVEIMAILTMMVVFFIGGHLVIQEYNVSGEFFVFYILIFARLIPPAKSLITCFYNVQKGLASAQRIYKILDGEEKIVEHENPLSIRELKSEIEYKEVSFSYNEHTEVLHRISFTLHKGETIAIVGPSGSGKSTLVDLLPRFYDLSTGEILIDGKPQQLYKISDLRALFGIVNQDIILFHDTVSQNIAFGRHDVSQDKITEAAKMAKAHDFIMEMENGYDTIIGDRGMRLSGGERQRISIARAILYDPQVLILDEATSSLDVESEQFVQQAINNLLSNRTAIIIAHRLSTIRQVDKIYYIEDGKIVESGTHDELMQLQGAYFKFYSLQLDSEVVE